MKICPPIFSGLPLGWENDIIFKNSHGKKLWHISKFSYGSYKNFGMVRTLVTKKTRVCLRHSVVREEDIAIAMLWFSLKHKAICTRGYPSKHHVQVVLEVKEDKVDKFLELIPGLFFGSQVASSFRMCLYDGVCCCTLLLSLEKSWLYLQWAAEGDRHQHLLPDRGLGVKGGSWRWHCGGSRHGLLHWDGHRVGGAGAGHWQGHHHDSQRDEDSSHRVNIASTISKLI